MKTTFYLVRHGVTLANKENRFAGRTAETLHPEGVDQILEVGARLRSCGISFIYSGPLYRTARSASLMQEMLGVPVIAAESLNEIRIPHWDGLTKQDIRAEFGDEYPVWLKAPQDFNSPGCETLADVQSRAVKLMERLLSIHGGENLLIVSHLIVVRCIILYYQGRSISDFRTIKIDNGAVTRIVVDDAGGAAVNDFPGHRE